MTTRNGQIMENELCLVIFRKEDGVQELEVIMPLGADSSPEAEFNTWCALYPHCNVWATWDHNGVFGGKRSWK
jgi:hypothetical protein